ncbi:MAG: L-histidine N(alpha)-methyltransferase [Candidatus Aenigmarchaeota archaeon]|nr:L-histidine N(alpha)-methyltransferase [Candidatus Aenigmarchaeota archaeon]
MLEISSPIENLIIKRANEKILDERLFLGIKNKMITGEQWFRNPDNWYNITAFANPHKTPYSELRILFENEDELKPLLDNTIKIFYGIGMGETETLIVKWDLENNNYTEVIAIDAINVFIENFIQILRNLKYNYSKSEIFFRGIRDLFENLNKDDLFFSRSKFENATHICFGNTIGNFEQQNEIFTIFQKNMDRGDKLLLGIHLNKFPEKTFSEYANNVLFKKLILNSIKFDGDLYWKYNRDDDRVEAWFGDVLAFQSKKYDLKKLLEFVKEFGLISIRTFEHQEFAVVLFEKEN